MYRNVEEIGKIDNFKIYRNIKTGIAFVDDTEHGVIWSCHPMLSSDASIQMTRVNGIWKKEASIARNNGFIFNVDELDIVNPYNRLMLNYCECRGCRRRRKLNKLC